MAIYRLHINPISRGKGQSVVACAAYRAGVKLWDARYNVTHDYRQKKDVVYEEILISPDAPAWFKNREALWNHVEEIEKREDARLAREVQLTLPRELTLAQNTVLVRDFILQEFVALGMVADLAIHNHLNRQGEAQPHAHVLITTRGVEGGQLALKKNTDWNRRAWLLHWREAWANTVNGHLAQHGHDKQVDHRSLKDQGIVLEPQHKIGSDITRGREARLADHQRIARENGEQILNNPSLALNVLTRYQATFTARELSRFISRHTADAEQFMTVYHALYQSPELIELDLSDAGEQRFTTLGMIELEQQLTQDAEALSELASFTVNQKTLETVKHHYALSDEQQDALHHLTEGANLTGLIGYAGTGKSYVLQAARETWEAAGYQVQGLALSGMAALNLQQSAGIKSQTVARGLSLFVQGYVKLTSQDIVVIDEAGLLGTQAMAAIIRQVTQAGAKLVVVGDPQQLQPIEAGGAFRLLANTTPLATLSVVRRQRQAWQREATRELAEGEVTTAIQRYEAAGQVHYLATKNAAIAQLMADWQTAQIALPAHTSLLLAYRRADVARLNELAHVAGLSDGKLGECGLFETVRGVREFAVGERVYFLKRNKALGVINGTLGTIKCLEAATGTLQLALDGEQGEAQRLVTVDIQSYPHLDYGYATTVHKAQGITVDRSYILLSKHDDAHTAYVALSRHRDECTLYVGQDEFVEPRVLYAQLSRLRQQDLIVDYRSIKPLTGNNPATALYEGVRPPAEQAISYIRQLQEYRSSLTTCSFSATLRDQVSLRTHQLSSTDKVMRYFEQTAPALMSQIKQWVTVNQRCHQEQRLYSTKVYQKRRDLDVDLEL